MKFKQLMIDIAKFGDNLLIQEWNKSKKRNSMR